MALLLNGKKIVRRDGFSLVEVAMSLAIVGFACVAMLGLIPMGLTSFNRAMGNTIEADIVQNLTNDVLQANFSNLYQYNNQTYWYDNEGTYLGTGATAPTGASWVYKAVVTMKGVGTNTGGTYAPAALANGAVASVTSSTASTTSAYNVTITITAVNNRLQPDLFSVIVSNNNL